MYCIVIAVVSGPVILTTRGDCGNCIAAVDHKLPRELVHICLTIASFILVQIVNKNIQESLADTKVNA